MSEDSGHQVRDRIGVAFTPRPAEQLESGVRCMVVLPSAARWRVPSGTLLTVLVTAAAAIALVAVGYGVWGLQSQVTGPMGSTGYGPMGQPPGSGVGGLSRNPTALQGTVVSTLAQARSLASPAIKLPDVSVSGQPAKIVVWSLRHPDAVVTSRLAALERARIAIGVVYPRGIVLVATPPQDPYPSSAGIEDLREITSQWRGNAHDHLGSLWRGGLFNPSWSPNWWPFFDGREHTGTLRIVNGRETYIQQQGVAYVPGHSDVTEAIPSTAAWIDDGISYQLLAHPDLPVQELVRLAAAIR